MDEKNGLKKILINMEDDNLPPSDPPPVPPATSINVEGLRSDGGYYNPEMEGPGAPQPQPRSPQKNSGSILKLLDDSKTIVDNYFDERANEDQKPIRKGKDLIG